MRLIKAEHVHVKTVITVTHWPRKRIHVKRTITTKVVHFGKPVESPVIVGQTTRRRTVRPFEA